jgi:hypothetical protein
MPSHLISRIRLISTTLVPRVIYFFTLRFGAAAVVTGKSIRNGRTDLVCLALQNIARLPVFSFFYECTFLECTSLCMSVVLLLSMYYGGRRRDPRWSCFHVNTAPLENFHSVICLRNPTCRFEYVALSCNLYTCVFVCLLAGCNFGEALRAESPTLRVANRGNVGWNEGRDHILSE